MLVSRTLGDFARFKSARDVADSIQRALQPRAPIEQAKSILLALHGVDADEAFDLLRRESQATNTRLHATELVTRLSTPATDDSPTTDRNRFIRTDGINDPTVLRRASGSLPHRLNGV